MPEPNTDVFIEGFRHLRESGKVRAWGVSTSDIDLLRRFNADGDCDVIQVDYSILNRTPEAEILPYCLENGIGVIVRGPLAMGLLAGKFTATDTFPDHDFRHAWIDDPEQNAQFLQDLDAVEQLRAVVPDGAVDVGVRPALRAQPSGGQHRDPGRAQPRAGGAQRRGRPRAAAQRRRARGDRPHRAAGRRSPDLAGLTRPG